jgi:cbb3-type cytochrome c oxidase subunit III
MRILVRALSVAALVLAVSAFLSQCARRESAKPVVAIEAGTGAQAFLGYCAMCHGPSGAGDGPLARALQGQGVVVLRLDDGARLQALGFDGVRRVVSEGGGHTGRSNMMPAWSEQLAPALIDSIATYVLTLPSQSPGVPEATVQKFLTAPAGSSEAGRRLYVFYCSGCHGPGGKGDGLNADTLRVRNNIRPRNLTDSTYFAGRTDQQIYDVVALGGGHMGKSVYMPAWTFTLSPEEIKDLVSYVRVLSSGRAGP